MSTDKSGKEGRQEMLNKVRNTADKVEEQLHKCKKNINDLSMAIASLNDEYVELEAKEAQCVKDMQTTLQSSVLFLPIQLLVKKINLRSIFNYTPCEFPFL